MDPIIVDTPDGGTAEFPAGTPMDVIKGALAKRFPKPGDGRSGVGKAFSGFRRAHDLVTQSVRDGIIDTVGAPVDAISWARRQAGDTSVGPMPLGGSASLSHAADYFGTLPGRVVDAVSQGSVEPLTDNRTGRIKPAEGVEKIVSGAAKGVGGVLSVAGPAAALARTAVGAAPSVPQRVAGVMAAQPGTQTAMGAVGGGVGEEFGPVAGFLAGGATGLAPYAARRLITPTSRLKPEEARLAQVATDEGIPLTIGQASGSKGWQGAESQLRKLPFSGNMMESQFDAQRRAFNQAVLKRADIQADRASPAVLDKAFDDIGGVYTDLIKRTGPVKIDRQFAQDVGTTIDEYGRMLGSDVAPKFKAYISDLAPLVRAVAAGQNPQMDAAVYQTIRSKIGKRAREAKDTDLKEALYGLQSALDDAAARTAPALAPEWSEARRVYRNLSVIDSAMTRAPQADAVTGNIPFGRLKEAVRGTDVGGYARGRGELNDLSRVGSFLSDKIPDSGTAQRGFWQGILTGGAAGSLNPLLIGGVAALPAAAGALRGASRNYLARLNNPREAPRGGGVNLLNEMFVKRLEEGRR